MAQPPGKPTRPKPAPVTPDRIRRIEINGDVLLIYNLTPEQTAYICEIFESLKDE